MKVWHSPHAVLYTYYDLHMPAIRSVPIFPLILPWPYMHHQEQGTAKSRKSTSPECTYPWTGPQESGDSAPTWKTRPSHHLLQPPPRSDECEVKCLFSKYVRTALIRIRLLEPVDCNKSWTVQKGPFLKHFRKITVDQKKQCKRLDYFARGDYINFKENSNILFHSFFAQGSRW